MATQRLPANADFPSSITLSITPPTSGVATNILILLHGLGDTHVPFKTLGEQLNLPNTACISIQGLNALPFESSQFQWADDLIFDSSTNSLDPDGGFKTATRVLGQDVVKDVLIEKCGYSPRDIVFFGLGQGGMAALSVAAANNNHEFGGIVSIGGPLPGEAPASMSPKSRTPILVCSGIDSQWVTPGGEQKLKNVFENVQISRYRRTGDNMPKDRAEMLPVMQFFAHRLRQAAPPGTIELG